MKGIKTVFENEEAARLLNYFISYKELITKNENKPLETELTAGLLEIKII
jgi:hypothetical protein